MSADDWLAERFEERRDHLRTVASRILGSPQEAEDAVQETWLRLSRSDARSIDNLGGWLTTVVGRICLDVLRARRTVDRSPEHSPARIDELAPDPELEAVQAESVGLALFVVLETLTPAERLAFVLHDLFAVPYDEIAPIAGRSPSATRQLASRARRRVQGTSGATQLDARRQRELVDAFLAASRAGEFGALLAVLDPDVVLRADAAAVARGSRGLTVGATAVAEAFCGRAEAARAVLVDGIAGAVWSLRGVPQIVIRFSFADDLIAGIELLGDAGYLRDVRLTAYGSRSEGPGKSTRR